MINDINSENKVSILISAMEERSRSLHIIRERVQNTGIWFLGIMLGIGGWVIQSNIIFYFLDKFFYLLCIIVVFLVIKYIYLENLYVGFKAQQKTLVRIESALGFFSNAFFDDKQESIYPKDWEKSGQEDDKGRFFETTYTLLNTGIIILSFVILLK